jgi:hypothetical protein
MLLESSYLLKDPITFLAIIFGFILKMIPVFVKSFELVLYLFKHVSHLFLEVINIIFGLDMFIGGKLIFFDLDLVFLLVLDVTDRFQVKCMAVVRSEKF